MKRILSLVILFMFLFACGPKPQWKTREGKKKQKYYNMQQYNNKKRDDVMIKNMKKEKAKKQ